MKKGTIILLAATVAMFALLGVFAVTSELNSYSQFVSDGYLIDPASTNAQDVADVGMIKFSSGGKYRERYASNVEFTDASGETQKVEQDRFLHYSDDSLGAFTKGVIVDLENIEDENYGYYSVTKNTLLVSTNSSYELNLKGENKSITEFLWKISEDQFMLVSPTVKLKIGDADINFEKYAEITYVDSGIVRVSNQDGVYETISEDSNLTTQGGQVLNLVGKGFFDGDGNELLSLDGLAIEDTSYTEVEDEDTPSLTIPNFVAEDGEDGDSGSDGTSGSSGTNGTEGESGETGNTGTSGQNGASGADGSTGNAGGIGYDGKKGTSANTDTTVASVTLNARPTVSLATTTTGEGESQEVTTDYTVNSTSATMTLQSSGSDATYQNVDSSSVKIKIYNKDTWEEITAKEISGEQAKKLMDGTTNKLDITYDGLTPNTTYVVVVSGEYIAEEGGDYIETTFLTKQFTTTELGLGISKYMVGENYISAATTLSDPDVVSYTLAFCQMDGDNGSKGTDWAVYTMSTGATGTDTPTSDNYKIVDGKNTFYCYLEGDGTAITNEVSGVRTDTGKTKTVTHNGTYYAVITSVKMKGGTELSYPTDLRDLVVELKTLKKTPTDTINGSETTIENVTPTLTNNTLTHSLTLELPGTMNDPDNGIISYTYQLYTVDDTNGNTLKYEKTYETKQPVNFVIDDDDTSVYVGRVIVNFDNNEQEVQYYSQFSSASYLAASDNSNVSIDIKYDKKDENYPVSAYPDIINGSIIITDKGATVTALKDPMTSIDKENCNITGGSIMQYVNNGIPIKIQFSGNNDIITQNITASSIQYDSVNGYFTIPLHQEGLRSSYTEGTTLMATYYSIRVYGPYDTNKDDSVAESSTEATTFLNSVNLAMGSSYSLQAVGTINLNSSDSDFELLLGFTTPAATAGQDDEGNDITSVATLKALAAANASTVTNPIEVQRNTKDKLVYGLTKIDSTLTDTADYNNEDFYEYETSTINTVTVSLAANQSGKVTQLGNKKIYIDGKTDEDGNHRNSLFNSTFYSRSTVTERSDTSYEGLEKSDESFEGKDAEIVITPKDFNANLDSYDSNTWFEITVESITDYAGNDIPVDSYYDTIRFKIREKHKVDTAIGDTVLETTKITKKTANSTYLTAASGSTNKEVFEGVNQLDSDDSTVSVGMRFNAKYDNLPYNDQKYDGENIEVIYTIYELSEKWADSVDTLDGNEDPDAAIKFYDVDYYASLRTALGLDGDANEATFESMFSDYSAGTSATYQAIKTQTNYLTKKAVIETNTLDPVEIYYEGTKAYQLNADYTVADNLAVKDKDGNTISETDSCLERGARYIVSYVIITETDTRICNSSRLQSIKNDSTISKANALFTDKDIYPYCSANAYGYIDSTTKQYKFYTYSSGDNAGKPVYYDNMDGKITAVPLLRSYIREDEKIEPYIGRYLNETGSWNNARCMKYTYFIFDPDQAIPVSTDYTYGAGDGTTYVYVERLGDTTQLTYNPNFYAKMKLPTYSTSYDDTYNSSEPKSINGAYYTSLILGGSAQTFTTDGSGVIGTKITNSNIYSLVNSRRYRATVYYALTDYAARNGTLEEGWESLSYSDVFTVGTYPNSSSGTISSRNVQCAGKYSVDGDGTVLTQESAVVSEGGYQIAVRVRGTASALNNIVAYRVAISNNSSNPFASGAKTVVYDPVYIDKSRSDKETINDKLNLNTTNTAENTETIVLDIGPLYGTFINKDTLEVITGNCADSTGKVYVYVYGYYDYYPSGYGTYTTSDGTTGTAWNAINSYNTLPSGKSFFINSTDENLYANRLGGEDDESVSYYKNPSASSDNLSSMKFTSVAIPGDSSGTKTGLTFTWNTYKTLGMNVQYRNIYYTDSMSKASDATTYVIDTSSASTILANGPSDKNGQHVIPEKLRKVPFKFREDLDGDPSTIEDVSAYPFTLTDALPAVVQVDDECTKRLGQRTYGHYVTVSGLSTIGSPNIYAMLYDTDAKKYIKLETKNGGESFSVVKQDNSVVMDSDYTKYYSYSDYGGESIKQDTANAAIFNLRNLEADHNYKIVYFTYLGDEHNIQFLWRTDSDKYNSADPFTFKTKDKLDLTMPSDAIHYTYTNYDTKYAEIDYMVKTASDGYSQGSRIYWALFKESAINSSSKTDGTYDDALVSSLSASDLLAKGYTKKINDETEDEYYGSSAGSNSKIVLPMEPEGTEDANLSVGETYCLRIYVGANSEDASYKYDGTIPDLISEGGDDGHIDLVFTVPKEAEVKSGSVVTIPKHDTAYLDDPTITLNVSQKRDTDGTIVLYTDATVIDRMNALVDDEYYLAVFDEDENIVAYKKITRSFTTVGDEKVVTDDPEIVSSFQWKEGDNSDPSNKTKLTLVSGEEYTIRALAHIDINNDGEADIYTKDSSNTYVGTKHARVSDFISATTIDSEDLKKDFCIIEEKTITAKKAISANIECTTSTDSSLALRFSQTQNMAGNVDSILITVYDSSGNDVFTSEVIADGSDLTEDYYTVTFSGYDKPNDGESFTQVDPSTFIVTFSGSNWTDAMEDVLTQETKNFTASFKLMKSGKSVGSDLNTCSFAMKKSSVLNGLSLFRTRAKVECQHEDEDKDGICDLCGEEIEVEEEEEDSKASSEEESDSNKEESDEKEESKSEASKTEASTNTKKDDAAVEEKETSSGSTDEDKE